MSDWWYVQSQNGANEDDDRLIELSVAGVSFDDRQAVLARMHVGEILWLVREPHNPYDRNAIRVQRSSGEQVGYVPRGFAAVLAPGFDELGEPVRAAVTAIVGGYYAGSSLGVRIQFERPSSTSPIAPPSVIDGFSVDDL